MQQGTKRVSPADPCWAWRQHRAKSCFSPNKMINSTLLCCARQIKQKSTGGFLSSASSLPVTSLRDYTVRFSPGAPAEQAVPTRGRNQESVLVCLTATMTRCRVQISRDSGACGTSHVTKSVTKLQVHFHNDVTFDFQAGWLLRCNLHTISNTYRSEAKFRLGHFFIQTIQ